MSVRRLSLLLVLCAVAATAFPREAVAAHVQRPAIAGTAGVHKLLAARLGRWGRHTRRVRYAWLRCDRGGRRCAAIGRAHSRRYVVRVRDAGHRLRVRVTALRRRHAPRRSVYQRVRATSRATAVVRSSNSHNGAPTPAPPAPGTPPVGTPAPGGGPSAGLHVSGNRLLDARGNPVHLHGVNYSGTEYACIQGWGIFDGPSDDASVAAMASWHANIVHLGLNEDCLLGINGVKPAYGGAAYLGAITDYVHRLHARGMYAEVSLMWAAPGTTQALGHPPILDQDHAGDALRAIANAFKDDAETIIGLQSEPHDIGWDCWAQGGSACSVGYPALGMQAALDAVRATGATNVVSASGIDYANNLTQWLNLRPNDPLRNLMAEAHVYGGNTCDTSACLDAQMAPVAAQVPLIFGETGETYDGNACHSTSHIAQFLPWADAHGVGYEAWQWNAWGTCLDLTAAPDGTVADNDYARYVHAHYAALL